VTGDGPRPVRVRNEGFPSNSYVLPGDDPARCVVIDPGLDIAGMAAALDAIGSVPEAVMVTHGHFDHIAGAAALQRRFDIPVLLHAADTRVAARSGLLMMALRIDAPLELPAAMLPIDEGIVWDRNGIRVVALHVPGHTPGSCVLRVGDAAFTGDTLYRDEMFLVRLPEQDRDALTASLRRLWDLLPDDVTIHPGHGGAGPMGGIRASNSKLRAFLGLEGAPA
jgi:hydroxyacylglutathione hydrolase